MGEGGDAANRRERASRGWHRVNGRHSKAHCSTRDGTRTYVPFLSDIDLRPVPLLPPIWKCAFAKLSLPQLDGLLSSLFVLSVYSPQPVVRPFALSKASCPCSPTSSDSAYEKNPVAAWFIGNCWFSFKDSTMLERSAYCHPSALFGLRCVLKSLPDHCKWTRSDVASFMSPGAQSYSTRGYLRAARRVRGGGWGGGTERCGAHCEQRASLLECAALSRRRARETRRTLARCCRARRACSS